METSIKENGKKEIKVGVVCMILRIMINTKDIGNSEKDMGKVFINGIMVKNITEIG